MLYFAMGLAALVLTLFLWRAWKVWTFQTPESFRTPRALRARIEPCGSEPHRPSLPNWRSRTSRWRRNGSARWTSAKSA